MKSCSVVLNELVLRLQILALSVETITYCADAPFSPCNVCLSCSSTTKRQHISTAGSNYSGAEKSHLQQASP